MDEASVDAIVTDPPYHLSFMGRAWDSVSSPAESQREHERWAREALRVLKPGGHLLAFGGTRTAHRLACGIEDTGFEIRDTIAWLYGSGFPKSRHVGRAIDNELGVKRTEAVPYQAPDGGRRGPRKTGLGSRAHAVEHGFRPDGPEYPDAATVARTMSMPATPEAEQWEGWGTALKPAHEPIVVARKPLAGTVAGNVLEHGTGALNVDGCRIGGAWENPSVGLGAGYEAHNKLDRKYGNGLGGIVADPHPGGRWPANVVLDPEAAAMLDEQTEKPTSRFFYCAKSSATERSAGLGGSRNIHPTCKPVALMRWLVRLVTPPGGRVLDPFAGSGTTGIAAALEGFEFVGIEREAEYVEIARARIAHWQAQPQQLDFAA